MVPLTRGGTSEYTLFKSVHGCNEPVRIKVLTVVSWRRTFSAVNSREYVCQMNM